MSIDPGWYPAEGDPPNTVRYWNGTEWQGGPQAPPAQGAGPENQARQEPNISASSLYAPTPADEFSEPQTPPPAWGQAPAQGFDPATSGSPAAGNTVEPGWYPADGDPPNTMRYWTGTAWQGGPTYAGAAYATAVPSPSLSPLAYIQRAVTERYFDFNGRARRAEFGWFILLAWIAAAVLSTLLDRAGTPAFVGVFWLAAFIPYLSVSVRRLHDINISGWALIAMIVPIVNFVFFLVMLFSDSSRAPNKWGRSPKYG